MFWSRLKQEDKQVNSKLIEAIELNALDIAKLKTEIEGLAQHLKSLRGLVNKKLNYEESEDIKTSDSKFI